MLRRASKLRCCEVLEWDQQLTLAGHHGQPLTLATNSSGRLFIVARCALPFSNSLSGSVSQTTDDRVNTGMCPIQLQESTELFKRSLKREKIKHFCPEEKDRSVATPHRPPRKGSVSRGLRLTSKGNTALPAQLHSLCPPVCFALSLTH